MSSQTEHAAMTQRFILTLSCPNRPGIVAAVSGLIFEVGFNIFDAHQFDDTETGRFFMRVGFNTVDRDGVVNAAALQRFESGFAVIRGQFGMDATVQPDDKPRRVMILASQSDHCLSDLLYRLRIGELPVTISAIVSNHPRETYAHLDFGDAVRVGRGLRLRHERAALLVGVEHEIDERARPARRLLLHAAETRVAGQGDRAGLRAKLA